MNRNSEQYALTSLQKSMALAWMRAPQSGAYILQYVCEMAEELDDTLLESAWRQIVRRYAPLRTSITLDAENKLWQRVHEQSEIKWQRLDWTDKSAAERSASERPAQLAEFLRADWGLGFDFDGSVPIRITLVRASERSYTLILTFHHVLLDGRSLAIAWKEWFAIYDASRRGETIAFPPAKDFRAHITWLERHDWGQTERYWRRKFEGLSQTTDYIVDRLSKERHDLGVDAFAKERVQLSEEKTRKVEAFAQQHGLTVNTLVQAAWALLLARYSSRSDVVFGGTRAGRHTPAAEGGDLVGMLINTVPMRIAVPPDAPLIPWLRQVREQWIELREYEHSPIEKIAEWSGLLPGTPPFDNVFVYEHQPLAQSMRNLGGGWENRSITRTQRTDSMLTLVAFGRPAVTLEIVYNQRLFSRAFVAGMVRHLSTLLENFIAQRDQLLGEVKMLSEDEERNLIHEVNRTEADYPRDLCIHRLFEQQAARIPDHPAFDTPQGVISYGEANRRANRLARFLGERGAGAEDLVAVCMDRSPEAVIAVLGSVKAGAAFLPLDPRFPQARLISMLEDAHPKFVLTDDSTFSKLESYGSCVVNLDGLANDIERQPCGNLPDIAGPNNAAYAIYTSGSTGKPKAVVIMHTSLVNYVLVSRRAYELTEADRRIQIAWLGTDFVVAEIFNYLCSGATLVYCLNRDGYTLAEYLQVLDEQKITITGIPSTWWHEWVASFSANGWRKPEALRVVITGMEQVNPAALESWKRTVGTEIRWFNAYGPTETTCTSTLYAAASSEWEGERYVPIGTPVANTLAYVLDDRQNPVPVGVPGELYIGGVGVGRGYLNSPELTAERFLPDPFRADADARMYRTGDRVFRLPDGNLVFIGRLDRQVKIHGFRVELDEIEAVLSRHASVRECAVIVQGREGEQRLIAYLSALSATGETDLKALRHHLASHLAAHMIPAVFVVLPELPRTSGGKINRQSLSMLEPDLAASSTEVQAPVTPTESLLSELWSQTLRIPVADTSANFFELGGDSLKAAQLIVAIHDRLGLELPFSTLLHAPTIARIAAILDSGDFEIAGQASSGSDAIIPVQPHGSSMPLFCVSPTLQGPFCYRHLAKQLGSDQPFFVARVLPKETERVPTVEELAARAAESIRAARPQGPYIIGGYCFGGSVAFETARCLKLSGAEVVSIVLFDTPAPGYPKVLREHGRNLGRLGKILVSGEQRNRIGVGEIISHLDRTGQLIKRKILGQTGRGIARFELTNLAPAVKDVERWQERSASMYVLKRTDIPVVQFIAQDEPISTRILHDPRLAWRELCEEFEAHRVGGSHGTMLGEERAPEVANILRGFFRRLGGAAAELNGLKNASSAGA